MKDKNVIVFYFPDHALDLYESDEMHVGHAKETPISTKYGSAIPMMVYASPLYIELFPNEYRRLKESQEKNFSTKDIIYTITDIAGYSVVDDKSFSNNYSLLK